MTHAFDSTRTITLGQFEAMPESDRYRIERSRGLVVREPRPGAPHGYSAGRIYALLLDQEKRGEGHAVIESGFLLSSDAPPHRRRARARRRGAVRPGVRHTDQEVAARAVRGLLTSLDTRATARQLGGEIEAIEEPVIYRANLHPDHSAGDRPFRRAEARHAKGHSAGI
jgi:hypothetical protein